MSTVFSSRALCSVYGQDEQQMLGRRGGEGGEVTGAGVINSLLFM